MCKYNPIEYIIYISSNRNNQFMISINHTQPPADLVTIDTISLMDILSRANIYAFNSHLCDTFPENLLIFFLERTKILSVYNFPDILANSLQKMDNFNGVIEFVNNNPSPIFSDENISEIFKLIVHKNYRYVGFRGFTFKSCTSYSFSDYLKEITPFIVLLKIHECKFVDLDNQINNSLHGYLFENMKYLLVSDKTVLNFFEDHINNDCMRTISSLETFMADFVDNGCCQHSPKVKSAKK